MPYDADPVDCPGNPMNIMERIMDWESAGGVQTFRAIGVAEGSRVLDFGFGAGHYAVAAANAVGPSGLVYAIDCASVSVEGLQKRILEERIASISVMQTEGGADIALPDGSADCMLLYDILHFDGLDRQRLVAEAHRVLRAGGILSVLPFHMPEDAVQRLNEDIVAAGFGLPAVMPGSGLHLGMLYSAYRENAGAEFDSVEKGTMYNFLKN